MERKKKKREKWKQWENAKRHHNMKLVYDAVRIAQIHVAKKNQLAMQFPPKMPASQIFFFHQIKSWEFQLNFVFTVFWWKKNSTHWHIVVVFFLVLSRSSYFFFTTKLKIIARKKMRVTDFFGVHLLCVYTNRYALFCVKLRSMCYMFVFSFSFQSAFKYILLCYFRLFYPKTVLHFMPLLKTLLFFF